MQEKSDFSQYWVGWESTFILFPLSCLVLGILYLSRFIFHFALSGWWIPGGAAIVTGLWFVVMLVGWIIELNHKKKLESQGHHLPCIQTTEDDDTGKLIFIPTVCNPDYFLYHPKGDKPYIIMPDKNERFSEHSFSKNKDWSKYHTLKEAEEAIIGYSDAIKKNSEKMVDIRTYDEFEIERAKERRKELQ